MKTGWGKGRKPEGKQKEKKSWKSCVVHRKATYVRSPHMRSNMRDPVVSNSQRPNLRSPTFSLMQFDQLAKYPI